MADEILKRLIKTKTSEALHSSAYGEAQNGGRFGVASTESFAHRMEVDRNRTQVQGYKDSRVRNEGGNVWEKAGAFSADAEASQRAAIRERFGGGRDNGVGESRTSGTAGEGNNGGVSTISRGGQGVDRFAPSKPLSSATPPARRNSGISR